MGARISRRQLATYVADRLSDGDTSVLKELAAYVVEERLGRELDLIVSEIEAEFAARGHVVADVTSAHALGEDDHDASRSEIRRFIAEATGAKSVEIREDVDAALIGGVVIETPGKYFDGSLASQLNQLKVKA